MSTQKTAWMIVASCCLLLLTSGGLAQAWEVDREIDPITDEKNVTASLRGQVVGTIVDGLTLDDLPGVTAEIHISCNDIGSFYPSKDFFLILAIAPPPLLMDAKPGPRKTFWERGVLGIVTWYYDLTARNQQLSGGSRRSQITLVFQALYRHTSLMRSSNGWPQEYTTNWRCALCSTM